MPIVRVALDTPLPQRFDYRCEEVVALGQLVWVPFGRGDRQRIAIVLEFAERSDWQQLKSVSAVIHACPPLAPAWLDFCQFAATYYHHSIGTVILSSLPKNLRVASTLTQPKTSRTRKAASATSPADTSATPHDLPTLNPEQATAVEAIGAAQGYAPILLYGITGSGKTEVYLHACAKILTQQAQAQVLILVPEINLTPQWLARVTARFATESVVTLHSGLSEGLRAKNWLQAHQGTARIILGTRLAIMASIPNLALIVVDEEHDPSYKQQEGWHYSARDLALWRAHQLQLPIVLGSATPALETWHNYQKGRFTCLPLTQRAGNATPPAIRCIDSQQHPTVEGLSGPVLEAIEDRLAHQEQVLLFLNRRGYAPVLSCPACAWVSQCPNCQAMRVLHSADRRLHCHLCATQSAIPRACPACGNPDIVPLGRGTQRVEEHLRQLFTQHPVAPRPIEILRIDADSVRLKGAAETAFARVHRREVDIVLGTQMVSKGHDFAGITLVAVLNSDSALFSADFRAPERLFAQLMQVAGRAGRAQLGAGRKSEVLIQTRYPDHPLYQALRAQDYAQYAHTLLAERESVGLPPFRFQALLNAQANDMTVAIEFLHAAAAAMPVDPALTVHAPMPMAIAKVANLFRAQMLIEAFARSHLQQALSAWVPQLHQMKTRARWQLEIDPLAI